MKRAVLVDSGAVLALLDRRDANHSRAVGVLGRIADEKRPILMTNHLQAETHALLLARLGRVAAREWLLRGEVPVHRTTAEEEAGAREIIARHFDKDWSLCDALSFGFMERRGINTAFAFDRHFRQYGRFQVWGPSDSPGPG